MCQPSLFCRENAIVLFKVLWYAHKIKLETWIDRNKAAKEGNRMNTIGSDSFQKGQKDIAEKLVRRQFLAGVALAFFIAAMELLLFMLEREGAVWPVQMVYLRRFVIVPSVLNFVAAIFVAVFLHYVKNKQARSYAVSLMHTFFAFVVYATHIRFPSLYLVFAISILLTVAYGNIRKTSIIAAICLLLKTVSDFCFAPDPSEMLYMTMRWRLEPGDFIISFMGLVVFYLLCLVVIASEREKNALAVQQERENVQLFHRIMTDTLTGVRNRNALRISFDHVIEDKRDTEYILAMLDIDYFKNVNDTFGHLVGDEYLQALGKVLETVPDAQAFRFGGDEFCLLFTGCTKEQAAERCRAAQEKYLKSELCKKYADVNVSFGLAEYDHAATPSEWIQFADEALYEAKKNRGSICFYEPEKEKIQE